MYYYVNQNELYHHGILGMKWGIRRFQPYRDGERKGKEVGEAAKNKRPSKKKEDPRVIQNKVDAIFDHQLKYTNEVEKRANNRYGKRDEDGRIFIETSEDAKKHRNLIKQAEKEVKQEIRKDYENNRLPYSDKQINEWRNDTLTSRKRSYDVSSQNTYYDEEEKIHERAANRAAPLEKKLRNRTIGKAVVTSSLATVANVGVRLIGGGTAGGAAMGASIGIGLGVKKLYDKGDAIIKDALLKIQEDEMDELDALDDAWRKKYGSWPS